MKHAFLLCVPFTFLACASPQAPTQHENLDLQSVTSDLEGVEAALARVENRLGHLESEVSAANPKDEFTELSIDAVQASGDRLFAANPDRASNTFWCHAVEWRGFGKMLRFTRLADPVFYLEAEGRPQVTARIEAGGVCDDDGSTRFVVLKADSELQSGVAYRLRPRNENERYRWSVASDVVLEPK
ncbi:MAG TPA: hypothetical protein VK843_19070 [Planctomycetota bacterium]|nr:hypothetical protein [Planctomycetota bacterium]